LKKLLEVNEAVLKVAMSSLEVGKSAFATTLETKELLSAKIGEKEASRLSAKFYRKLPIIVSDPEELLSCSDDIQFSAVCDAVSTFANGILSLHRAEGADVKRDIQPLSKVMLESIAKVLLHPLDIDIVPEVAFQILIQTEGDTSLVSGKMDKALLFNSIDRFLLSYEDKNFTKEGVTKSGIAQAATQLMFLGRGLMKAYHIAHPRLVGFICDGVTFMILEYGFAEERETICRSKTVQLISNKRGGHSVNAQAVIDVAKLLVHGFLMAKSLGKVLEQKKTKFRAVDEVDDDEEKGERAFESKDENADDDTDLPELDNLKLGSVTAAATQFRPYNLRTFLDEDALLRHTLLCQD